jgi:hypothetical protein
MGTMIGVIAIDFRNLRMICVAKIVKSGEDCEKNSKKYLKMLHNVK